MLFRSDSVTLTLDGHEDSELKAKIETVAPLIVNDTGLSRREFVLQIDTNHVRFSLVPGMNGIAKLETDL